MAISRAQWCQYCYKACLFLLLAGYLTSSTNASSSSWWSIGLTGCGRTSKNGETFDCPNCAQFETINTFTQSQAQKCSAKPAEVISLAKGARAAIINCQLHFNGSRWNCSTLQGDHLFGAFVANDHTRETAVLNAYFAAGAVAALAEDCHHQRLSDCPCSVTNNQPTTVDAEGNSIFQTCNSDYTYSSGFIEDFVESQVDEGTLDGKMDVHNIHVGKNLVSDEIETCRCHGISGTCTSQTCYKRTSSVAEVGETLFQRYSSAVRVRLEDNELYNTNRDIHPSAPEVTEDNLVYNDASPNFCTENLDNGVLGVAHRQCSPDLHAPDSCNILCCNHGNYVKTRIMPIEECKFVYCCYYDCRIVRNDTIVEHFCNPPSGR